MKALQQLFSELYQFFTTDEAELVRKRNEAYLAQSVDLYDLEHRIRLLDRKAI